MYKLFTIITTRLAKKLDENQPREQVWFRSKYSTTDHIHAINQLKEKCREYNIPLSVAFVDYEKAFDSVQTQAILTSLQEQGIEDVYIEILKAIYTDSSTTVHLHKWENQDQQRSTTGGHHLTQAVHRNIGEHIQKVKLGKQGREDRRRISLQSPLCWWHIHMHRNTTITTTYAIRTIWWK